MRLFNLDLSPFAARCRIAIRKKGLPVELVPPPEGGARSDAYRLLNPLAKIPALVLGDGAVIPESEVILEYLEDAFPEPPLRPSLPEARARMRLLARIADLYLVPPMGRLVQPAEIAGLTAFLLGDAARSITGQQITVCAGSSL